MSDHGSDGGQSGSSAANGSETDPSGSSATDSGLSSSHASSHNSGSKIRSHSSARPRGLSLVSHNSAPAALSGSSQATGSQAGSQAEPGPVAASEGGGSEAPPNTPPSGAAASATSPSESQAGSRASSAAGPSRRKRRKGDLDIQQARIGFLGAGKMTESIVDGLLNFAKIPPRHIFVAAPSKKNLERFKALGCHASRRLIDIFARYDCDIIFLCFHGSVVKKAIKEGGQRPFPICINYIPNMRHPLYILSTVSGVKLNEVRDTLLNPEHPEKYVLEMHRIMMNTAVSFGLGICGVDCEPDSNKLTPPIRTLLGSIAKLEYVPEAQMDAACAIGGSGLAFAYYFIGAMADGAFKCGLSKPVALKFSSKTALCAAQCLIESGKHPSELRDDVTSPSGAAIFGIHVLDRAEVASGVTAAIEAAHKRAHELAQP